MEKKINVKDTVKKCAHATWNGTNVVLWTGVALYVAFIIDPIANGAIAVVDTITENAHRLIDG